MPPEQLVSGDGAAAGGASLDGDAASAALVGGAPARGVYDGMAWDVYSLAVTFVAMWAPGEALYPNYPLLQLVAAIVHGLRPPWPPLMPSLLRELIADMWVCEAALRPSARAVERRLHDDEMVSEVVYASGVEV